MGNALLTWIIFAMLAAAIAGARDASPRRGLRRALVLVALSCALFVAMILLVYAKLYQPEMW